MNKNLTYDDDENGGDLQSNFLSTLGKRGMGDYWVIDIFGAAPGATAGSTLVFAPEASLYWHEK